MKVRHQKIENPAFEHIIQNLEIDTVTINLRSKKKVHMKKDFTSKTKVLNSPLYRGLKFWDSLPSTGMNSRWQSGQHRVYMYSKGRTLNMYPQLCSLLFLDFWLFFLFYDGMKSFIHT